MIFLSFSFAALLYLFVSLGLLLAIGIYDILRKKEQRNVEYSSLFVCEYCQHLYVDDHDLKVTKCPHCQLLNQKNKYTPKLSPKK